MKNLTYLTFFFAIIFFNSCNEENKDELDKAKINEIEYLKSLCIDENNIEYDEENGNYIVEGDIIIPRENIIDLAPLSIDPNTDQLKSFFNPGNNVVDDAHVVDIKIAVSTLKSPTEAWTSQLPEAMKLWNDVPGCKIYIRQVPVGSHDIIMQGFTESSGYQAYAFYPSSGKPGSSINFNSVDRYSYTLTPSIRAEIIAHEIGHTLGFAHNWYVNPWDPNNINTNHIEGTTTSYNYNSIMVEPALGEYGICKDDIMGANAYYSLNNHTVSAALRYSNGTQRAYFFNGNQYTTYDMQTKVATSNQPQTITSGWTGSFSSDVDAALDWDENNVFIFKGSQFVRFNKSLNRVDYGPASINNGWWIGLFTSDIDAAVNWDSQYAFFFKGDKFVRFNKSLNKVDFGPTYISLPGQWDGIPNNIDAALEGGDGYIYFFKGNLFYAFNMSNNKLETGYPQSINYITWPGLAF